MYKLRLIFILLFSIYSSLLWGQTKPLKKGNPVPNFEKADVYGKQLSNRSLIGKKTLISFTRSAGCPICNLYVHELVVNADSFKKQGIDIIIVSQSSAQEIQSYIADEQIPFTFISDTEDGMYQLFSIEKSRSKIRKGVLKGGISKAQKGKKLYHKPLHYEGNKDIIGADFLIDEKGNIIHAFYGEYLGHRMTVTEILALF